MKDVVKQTSDAQGKFAFREIDPGEQGVTLDERSVPAGCHLTTASSVLRSLTEGDRGYVTFGVLCD